VLSVQGTPTNDDITIRRGLGTQSADDGEAVTPLSDPPADEVGVADVTGDGDADIYLAAEGLRRPFASTILIANGLGAQDVLMAKGGSDTGLDRTAPVILLGAGGEDLLQGGIGNDQLLGGSGEDVLDGDEGVDVLVAKSGTDTCINGPLHLGCELFPAGP
jgi:Ca2+-binding RTX toxin-like protein